MYWLFLGIIYFIINLAGIYLLHKILRTRLTDKLFVWLISISLSLVITFLLLLIGIILFLNYNFTKNLLTPASHV